MKSRFQPFVLTAALLAGCATPFSNPADLAGVLLDREDSARVRVEKVWLEREGGPLALKGYVMRRLGAPKEVQAHLDVAVYGADGTVIRRIDRAYDVARLPQRGRGADFAPYVIPLGTLPAGVSRIVVRAHEGGHS